MEATDDVSFGKSAWKQWRWIAALLLADLLVVVLATVSIRQSHEAYEAIAAVSSQNAAKLLSYDLGAGLDKIDLALLTLKDEVERHPAPMDPAAIAVAAERQLGRHSRLEFLRVTDAAGNVRGGSGLTEGNNVNVAKRDYFIKLRDQADAGLVISEPLSSYVDKKWSIVLARRVNDRHGAFAGIVFALIPLRTFEEVFATVNLGSKGAISLRALDLSTVTRYPPPETAGIMPGDRTVSAQWREQLEANPTSGTYHATSPDGVSRQLSYARVRHHPFYVVVGMSPADYFSNWRKELIATMALTIAIILTSLVIAHGWWRRAIDARRILELQAKALQHSREHLKLAIDGADMGTWISNFRPGTTTTSDKTRAILGGLAAETVGTAHIFSAVHPDDRKIVMAAARRSIDDGATFDVRARIKHPERGFRWVHAIGQWLRDSDDKRETMIGIIRDVTSEIDDLDALRRAKADAETALEAYAASERELRHLTSSLEQRVQEEVGRREAAQARLAHAQRLEAIGQLAGGVAHDFNNVIQVVQGCAEIIEAGDNDPQQAQHLGKIILEASTRGAAITSRLLAFSRRSDLVADSVEVYSMLEALRDMLVHTLGAGIAIELILEPDLPHLRADKAQLETVLVNIAINARDAMNDTGTLYISVCAERIEREAQQSQIDLLSPGDYVRITVSDTGAGMSSEVLARACEPFFSTKPVGQGTGLGLAMARGFAEQSGGALEIETELGRGTSVNLWFPAISGVADACPPRPSLGAPRKRHDRDTTILIVDDDPLVLDVLVRQMEKRGFVVRRASGADGALARLDDEVRLVITDLSMPDVDGLALIREIHRLRPELPTILLTGFPGKALDLEPGSNWCVMRKPANADELAETIDHLLAHDTEPVAGSAV